MAAADAQAASQREAEFRYAGREMYRSLLQPACEVLPGFSRDALLGDEKQAVRSFEKDMAGKSARDHALVVKADAALEAGCWMDSDKDLALTHVSMTKQTVRQRLAQMRELAPQLRALPLSSNGASTGGKFRLGVRRLVGSVHPLCSPVPDVSDDELFAPARERVSQLRNRLSGTELAAQFDVAEADVDYEHSITVVECELPSKTANLERARQDALQHAEQMIADLEVLIRR